MPQQTQKIPGFSLAKSVKKHAADPVDYGQDFNRLPPGMSGIARLTACGLGVYKTGANAGKTYFRAAGIVLEPESHTYSPQTFEGGKVVSKNAVTDRTRGRQTSVMVPLCDTQKGDGKGGKVTVSADENAADMANYLKQLGGEHYLDDVETDDDVIEKMNSLLQAGVTFKFSTRASKPTAAYPTPMTFETWHGACEFSGSDGIGAGTGTTEAPVDHSDANPEGFTDAELKKSASPKRQQPAPVEETVEEESAAEAEDDGLDALAEAADGGDQDAAAQLTKAASDAGIEEDSEGNLPGDTFADLVGHIRAAQSTEEESGESETEVEEPWKPAAGEQCLYQVLGPNGKPVIDPKTKKARKPALCQIKSIQAKAKTATLTDLTTKKEYAGVKIDSLSAPE